MLPRVIDMDSGFDGKIDALDLIITALKEHEKRLDEISHRLEDLSRAQPDDEDKPTKMKEIDRSLRRDSFKTKKEPLVVCATWSEFRAASRDANTVAFDIEGRFFNVYSLTDENIMKYKEELPSSKIRVTEETSGLTVDVASLEAVGQLQSFINRKLKCGLNLRVGGSETALTEIQFLYELKYDLNPLEIKEFLSRELNIPRERIADGRITY
jgi:hypothetical protein